MPSHHHPGWPWLRRLKCPDIDLSVPLLPERCRQRSTAAMDELAVLIFHDQKLTNEQQLAFTNPWATLSMRSVPACVEAIDYRLPTTFRRRLEPRQEQSSRSPVTTVAASSQLAIASGIPTALSRSSPRATPCSIHGPFHHKGGNTEFANMRMAYDAP